MTVDIDDLIEAFSVDPKRDYMITENQPEQATTKATVSQVQSIDLRSLPVLPDAMTAGDTFFGEEDITFDKFSSDFENITFPSGTKTWIYSDRIPLGWSTVAGTGDKLLAVQGGAVYTTAGIDGGAWLMEGVNGGNPGSALTPAQMPPHSHYARKAVHARPPGEIPDNFYPRKGKVKEDDVIERYRYFKTEFTGGSESHNHGDSWRPKAYVGLIIEKI